MSCITGKCQADDVLEAETGVPREAVPIRKRCPYCGTFTAHGVCQNAECPAKRPAEDYRLAEGATWERSPEPPPVRIIRAAVPLPSDLWAVLAAFREAGGRPYIAGGAARDLGQNIRDCDVEVYGLPAGRIRDILAQFGVVKVYGERFGVCRIRLPSGLEVEAAPPRRDNKVGAGHTGFAVEVDPAMSMREAGWRRDFRMNTLLWDPFTGTFYDFYDGRADLESGVLGAVSEAFLEDPNRPVRAARFCGERGLTATPETLAWSRAILPEHTHISPGVQWKEWSKLAARSERPSCALEFLRQSGWIEAYPELAALLVVPPELAAGLPAREGIPDGLPQDPAKHPEGGVWRHVLEVADAAARIAARDELPPVDRLVLVLSGINHDDGKPLATFRDPEDGRIKAHKHEEVGGPVIRAFLKRIGCPHAIQARVLCLCRWHMDGLQFRGSRKHLQRLVIDLAMAGETLRMLARLTEADQSAWHRAGGPAVPQAMADMLALAEQLGLADGPPKPLVTGDHMLALGWKRGRHLQEMRRATWSAQLRGEFRTEAEGVAWLRAHFRLPPVATPPA